MLPAFFKYYIQGNNDYLLTVLRKDKSTVDNIDLNLLQSHLVPVPTIVEQAAIVAYLDAKCAETDALITEKQKAAEVMRQYKKSLIYEYVTGKKRVTQ
jgi:type I restriction enzyme S subunit